jgi:hypothetical protein
MSQENLLSSLKGLVSTGASIAQTRLDFESVCYGDLHLILLIFWFGHVGYIGCDL